MVKHRKRKGGSAHQKMKFKHCAKKTCHNKGKQYRSCMKVCLRK